MTAALRSDNPELRAARQRGLLIMVRAETLAGLMLIIAPCAPRDRPARRPAHQHDRSERPNLLRCYVFVAERT